MFPGGQIESEGGKVAGGAESGNTIIMMTRVMMMMMMMMIMFKAEEGKVAVFTIPAFWGF